MRAPGPARRGGEQSRHSTPSAPSRSARTRGCALAEQLLADRAARREAAATLNQAVSLLADAPRSPIRALAEQVGQRSRLRLAERPDDVVARRRRFGLTEREADVLLLLGEARTNREIGEALFISPKTVSVHVSSIMRKLGVRRRADAARMARKDAAR